MDMENVVKRFADYVYYFKAYCTSDAEDHEMLKAVLALLKEQEAVEPEWKGGVPFCGNCGHRLQKKNRNMVGINCPMCKRSVKWE